MANSGDNGSLSPDGPTRLEQHPTPFPTLTPIIFNTKITIHMCDCPVLNSCQRYTISTISCMWHRMFCCTDGNNAEV